MISGNWEGTKGAFDTLTDIFLSMIYFKPYTQLDLTVPVEHNIFFYVVRGNITVNNIPIEAMHLVEFKNEGNIISFGAETDSIILFGHAKPFNEPMVAYGPFVMNSEQEIEQAYADYREGKFGKWME